MALIFIVERIVNAILAVNNYSQIGCLQLMTSIVLSLNKDIDEIGLQVIIMITTTMVVIQILHMGKNWIKKPRYNQIIVDHDGFGATTQTAAGITLTRTEYLKIKAEAIFMVDITIRVSMFTHYLAAENQNNNDNDYKSYLNQCKRVIIALPDLVSVVGFATNLNAWEIDVQSVGLFLSCVTTKQYLYNVSMTLQHFANHMSWGGHCPCTKYSKLCERIGKITCVQSILYDAERLWLYSSQKMILY